MRLLVCGLLSLALLPLLHAQNLKPQYEVGTSVVWGEALELVLRDGTYNNPISRLRWPVSPTVALDLAVNWPWSDWTSTALSVQILSPLSHGTMIDEDWHAWNSNHTTELIYGRSEHTAALTTHWSANASQEFHLGMVTASLGVLYKWSTWEGWNGEGTYTYDTPAVDTVSFSGPLIAYRQQWVLPWLGVAAAFVTGAGTFTPSVRVGPYGWGFDRDDHNYAQNVAPANKDAPLTFLDNTRGGLYGRVALEWVSGRESGWGLRVAAQSEWGSVGETIITQSLVANSGTHYTFDPNPNAAGAWFYDASVSVFMRN